MIDLTLHHDRTEATKIESLAARVVKCEEIYRITPGFPGAAAALNDARARLFAALANAQPVA